MKFAPWPYQRYALNRILEQPNLALWLGMGLGKTVITLTALNDLRYNRFEIGKTLIIAPKRVSQATWQKEASKWDHLHLLRFSTVLGTATQRIRALNQPADIYVTSRDLVCWLVEYYKNDWPFDTVILDESSSFKNHQAKRVKALAAIRPHIARMVQLTGTPASQGLMDIWSQIHLLDGGQRLEKRIGQYCEKYFAPDQRDRERVFSYRPKPGADEIIHEKIGDIVVSMKAEDYIDLPECVETTFPVVLDKPAEAAYQKLEKEMLLEVDESTIDAGSAAVLTNKLLQLCSGAVYDECKNVVKIHDCKIEAFLEIVEGLQGESALVFYNFKHDKDRILEALKSSGLRVAEFKGPEQEDAWNRKEIDILLAHPMSTAFGCNLQDGGHHVIWFGLTWSLELWQQANKRLHRQGQKESVFVHRLVVAGSVEEDVMDALDKKGEVQDRLMDALKARIQKAHA